MRNKVVCTLVILVFGVAVFYFVYKMDYIADSLADTIQYQINNNGN